MPFIFLFITFSSLWIPTRAIIKIKYHKKFLFKKERKLSAFVHTEKEDNKILVISIHIPFILLLSTVDGVRQECIKLQARVSEIIKICIWHNAGDIYESRESIRNQLFNTPSPCPTVKYMWGKWNEEIPQSKSEDFHK